MSPEQAMGELTIDGRSDIYALAAVTYEMLVGDAPFTGGSVQAILAKALSEKPTPARTPRDTVPPQVHTAVFTAPATLPADRFESGNASADALMNPTSGMAVGSTVIAGARAASPRSRVRHGVIANPVSSNG